MAEDSPTTPSRDVALVYGKDAETDAYHILRKRGEALESGTIRPLEHGKAVAGEVVSLDQRPEHPCLFDISPLNEGLEATISEREDDPHSGPVQVSNERFRDGWEHIWGKDDDGDQTLH